MPLTWNIWVLSLCIGRDRGLTESIHSHVIGIQNYVTLFLFRFCHDFTDYLSKLLIGKWCIVIIIIVNSSFQHLLKVFIFWGGHACLFILPVKSIQNISTTLEYVKIYRNLMCNWRFLIIGLILCVFYFVNILWTHSDSSSSVANLLTIMSFYSSSSVE